MDTQKREIATEEGFVWIPTGNNFGVPSGMVGYWHGELRTDYGGTERAVVEFLVDGETKELLVNRHAVYVATEEEAEKGIEV